MRDAAGRMYHPHLTAQDGEGGRPWAQEGQLDAMAEQQPAQHRHCLLFTGAGAAAAAAAGGVRGSWQYLSLLLRLPLLLLVLHMPLQEA